MSLLPLNRTVSEARSYDETTIQPPTRSYHSHPPHFGVAGGPGAPHYAGTESKHSSSGKTNNDEGHTMVERDLGSTYLMPQRHLYKLDHSRVSNEYLGTFFYLGNILLTRYGSRVGSILVSRDELEIWGLCIWCHRGGICISWTIAGWVFRYKEYNIWNLEKVIIIIIRPLFYWY